MNDTKQESDKIMDRLNALGLSEVKTFTLITCDESFTGLRVSPFYDHLIRPEIIKHKVIEAEPVLTQLEEIKAELDAKRKDGHLIVEHGYRMAAEHEVKDLKKEIEKLKAENSKLKETADYFQWFEGYPDKARAKEWFIAQTTYGDKVVLKALPEEYTYDFKTADETYIMKEKIQKWMQFPSSEFLSVSQMVDKIRNTSIPVEDVKQLLTVWDNFNTPKTFCNLGTFAGAIDVFIKKHGDKLK